MDFLERIASEFQSNVELRQPSPSDAIDGVLPRALAVPQDEDAAQKLVAFCGANDIAFIPRGGGSKLHLGAKPARCDLVISTEKLTEIFEHDEGNATIEAGAGITLAALNEFVGKKRQFVPFDDSENVVSTLGGTVATNHSGATKLRYGAPRDLVIGLRAALSDGRAIKAGSKVVKNVSGYDLNKLFIGSFGTLGLLTRVTIRLRPNDVAQREWRSTLANWAEAEALTQSILNGAFEPALLRVVAHGEQLELRARFDGSEAAVQSQLGRLPETQSEITDTPSLQSELELRAHLPITSGARWAQTAQGLGSSGVLWDSGLGIVYAQFEKAPENAEGVVEQLRALASEYDGVVVVLRAPQELKTASFVWGKPRGDFALQRKLKSTFDAANVCAPGRFIGGI
jgi:glycolate oxidase FAD binding subunit